MQRSTMRTGLAMARFALAAALAGAGCDAASERAVPRPPPIAAPAPQPRLAAARPGETWRPGYALVELVAGAALAGDRPAAATLAATAAPPTDSDSLGGVPVRPVRQIVPAGVPPGTAAGPIVLLELPALVGADPAATRRALSQIATDARVARVEPDRIRHRAGAPNDPLWPSQWNLPLIGLPQAWELTKGSADVVVGVLDTGIVYGHPDLEERLISGYDFISVASSANDDQPGRDSDPTDTGTVDSSRLHGTHVSGIIGAVTDNGLGVAGIDQRCRLMPLRVLGVNDGDGIDSDIAEAIRWSTGAQIDPLPRAPQPAHILNMSFGGPGISFTLQRVTDEAVGQGLIVIAAAGNGGDDASTYSPGGLDGVITVGAIDHGGARAEYSNYGPRVDLLAPGGGTADMPPGEATDLGPADPGGGDSDGVQSIYRDDGIPETSKPPFSYGTLTGTSQATPHVSGAAALVRAVLPTVRQHTLAQLLRTTANPDYLCPNSAVGGCGAGLLDVASLLQAAVRQRSCGCTGDLYCQDGACVPPTEIHPSVYDRPTLHASYCALVATPAPTGAGLLPLLLAAAAGRILRRRAQPRRSDVR
jgi:serine protease